MLKLSYNIKKERQCQGKLMIKAKRRRRRKGGSRQVKKKKGGNVLEQQKRRKNQKVGETAESWIYEKIERKKKVMSKKHVGDKIKENIAKERWKEMKELQRNGVFL